MLNLISEKNDVLKSKKTHVGKTKVFTIKKDRNFFRPLIQIMKKSIT